MRGPVKATGGLLTGRPVAEPCPSCGSWRSRRHPERVLRPHHPRGHMSGTRPATLRLVDLGREREATSGGQSRIRGTQAKGLRDTGAGGLQSYPGDKSKTSSGGCTESESQTHARSRPSHLVRPLSCCCRCGDMAQTLLTTGATCVRFSSLTGAGQASCTVAAETASPRGEGPTTAWLREE